MVSDEGLASSDWQDENPFTEPEAPEGGEEAVDPISGLPMASVMTDKQFFEQVFCLNFQLVAAISQMPELAIQFEGGKPEIGSREASKKIWTFCRRYKWLHFLVDAEGAYQEYQAIGTFVFGKVFIASKYKAARKEEAEEKPETEQPEEVAA